MTGASPYGLWTLVVVNSAVFILFALSFARPQTARDWRSFGAFSAFLVALFAEMYGYPLTIYLLSGWFGNRLGLDPLSHDAGHLWYSLLGFEGNAHLNPIHLLSNLLIAGGFITISSAWKTLHAARQNGTLASSGLYARVRHPQYIGFVVIMFGFLTQWPTIPTLVMFPILVTMYVRLAQREERESLAAFGNEWERYASAVPAFLRVSRVEGELTWGGALQLQVFFH